MTLKGKDLAELLQVTPQRVSILKKAGSIVPGADGLFDTNNQTNRAYIREHFQRELLDAKRREGSTGDDDADSLVDLERQELEERVRYTKERADERALMNASRRKDLFPRDTVLEYFSGFSSGLRTYILTIPGRVAPRVEAAIKTGSGEAIEILEAEIKDGIERAVAMGTDAMDDAYNAIEADDEAENDDDIPEV